MAGLSRAARGYKRGKLEMLIDPPALFHTSVSMTDRSKSTRVVYAVAAGVAFGAIGLIATMFSWVVAMAFFAFAIAPFVVLAEEASRSDRVSYDPKKEALRHALTFAARDAIEGKDDVSISSHIAAQLPDEDAEEYLNGLSYAQGKWLEREWEKALAQKTVEVEKEMRSLTPTQRAMIQDDVDSMLDKNEVRRIAQQRKALAELRSQDQKNLEEIKNAY